MLINDYLTMFPNPGNNQYPVEYPIDRSQLGEQHATSNADGAAYWSPFVANSYTHQMPLASMHHGCVCNYCSSM